MIISGQWEAMKGQWEVSGRSLEDHWKVMGWSMVMGVIQLEEMYSVFAFASAPKEHAAAECDGCCST